MAFSIDYSERTDNNTVTGVNHKVLEKEEVANLLLRLLDRNGLMVIKITNLDKVTKVK